jgi:HAD superfamily hydrolase (TIGR01509 family)
MIKGVLFDMDGVLVDSENFMSQAAIIMFSEFSITASPEDFKPFVGMGENKYLGGVAAKYGIDINIQHAKARAYEIYEEIVRGKLSPLPGALSIIKKCRDKGLMIALATSADQVKMEVNLKETGISPDLFHSIITGQDVVKKKPAPDIYLKAASSLGLSPENCLVVEDAVSGIKAGKTAGCKCLVVRSSIDKEKLKEADWVCESLLNVPEEALNW